MRDDLDKAGRRESESMKLPAFSLSGVRGRCRRRETSYAWFETRLPMKSVVP